MAGSKADTFEVQILKLATGQVHGLTGLTGTLAGPYLALYTAAPSDSAAGTEVSGGAYARVSTAGLWGAPTGTSPSTVANNGAVTFPTATASWGTIVAFALFDAVTAGNRTYWGDLTDATKTIGNGDTATFAIGAITVTED